jgi:hypothetical protein
VTDRDRALAFYRDTGLNPHCITITPGGCARHHMSTASHEHGTTLQSVAQLGSHFAHHRITTPRRRRGLNHIDTGVVGWCGWRWCVLHHTVCVAPHGVSSMWRWRTALLMTVSQRISAGVHVGRLAAASESIREMPATAGLEGGAAPGKPPLMFPTRDCAILCRSEINSIFFTPRSMHFVPASSARARK